MLLEGDILKTENKILKRINSFSNRKIAILNIKESAQALLNFEIRFWEEYCPSGNVGSSSVDAT